MTDELQSGPKLSLMGGGLLTKREEQVLEKAVSGAKKQDGADRLGIALRTYSTYMERIYQKFGAHNSTQLLAICIARGIVKIPPLALWISTFLVSSKIISIGAQLSRVAVLFVLTFQIVTAVNSDFIRPRNNRQHTTSRVTSVRTRTEYTA